MMKKIIYNIFPPVDRRRSHRRCPLVRNSHRNASTRPSSGALRRVCGFIHRAPGTDRASRSTVAAAASCAEGKPNEKRRGEKTLKTNRA